MCIDFTLLIDRTEGYAVRCRTQHEAEMFIQSVQESYPNMCEHWRPNETNFDQHESETVYTFDSRSAGNWIKRRLMYGSVDTVEQIGYKVIEFSNIYQEDDLNESEASLDVLFG
jgi:hypothetical protein